MLGARERCERHIGEVYPPRCADCDRTAAGAAIDRSEAKRLARVIGRAGYIPGSECSLHANYPLPA